MAKELLGADDCAGGKLFVAPPPKALVPPKLKAFPPLLLGAGAEAPKLKLDCCGGAKLALCVKVCIRALAICCACLRRISRRPAAIYLLVDMPGAAVARVVEGVLVRLGYSQRRRLLGVVLLPS